MSYYKNLIILANQGKKLAIREIVQYYINRNDQIAAEKWIKKLDDGDEEQQEQLAFAARLEERKEADDFINEEQWG